MSTLCISVGVLGLKTLHDLPTSLGEPKADGLGLGVWGLAFRVQGGFRVNECGPQTFQTTVKIEGRVMGS